MPASAEEQKAAKRGFFQRLNPFNLFRGDKAPVPTTPLGPAAAPPEGEPATKAAAGTELAAKPPPPTSNPPTARYAYKSPAKPVAGNRPEAERAFAQGVQAQQAQRLPEAMQAYRLAAQLDPSLFEAHYNLGLAATDAGNLPAALTAYENALAVQPQSLDARYNFALVLKQANYLADAVNELERVLASYPNEARAHLALGNLYAQQFQPAGQSAPALSEGAGSGPAASAGERDSLLAGGQPALAAIAEAGRRTGGPQLLEGAKTCPKGVSGTKLANNVHKSCIPRGCE